MYITITTMDGKKEEGKNEKQNINQMHTRTFSATVCNGGSHYSIKK